MGNEGVGIVGARIREERRRLGLTQHDAGIKCGVTGQMMGLYERDVYEMKGQPLKLFIEAGADYDFLVTGVHQSAIAGIMKRARAESSPDEQALLQAFRLSPDHSRGALLKIARVMPAADANVAALAHTFCRAILDEQGLALVPMFPHPTLTNAAELGFISKYRQLPRKMRAMVRGACDCTDARDDDDVINETTQCTHLEMRLLQFLRATSINIRQMVFAMVANADDANDHAIAS